MNEGEIRAQIEALKTDWLRAGSERTEAEKRVQKRIDEAQRDCAREIEDAQREYLDVLNGIAQDQARYEDDIKHWENELDDLLYGSERRALIEDGVSEARADAMLDCAANLDHPNQFVSWCAHEKWRAPGHIEIVYYPNMYDTFEEALGAAWGTWDNYPSRELCITYNGQLLAGGSKLDGLLNELDDQYDREREGKQPRENNK